MRWIIVGLGLLIGSGCMALWALTEAFPDRYPLAFLTRFPDYVVVAVNALIFSVPIVFVIFLFLYFLFYKRRLQQAEHDQLIGLMLHFERRLAELRQQLPPDNKK
jgi:hypothetical protein